MNNAWVDDNKTMWTISVTREAWDVSVSRYIVHHRRGHTGRSTRPGNEQRVTGG